MNDPNNELMARLAELFQSASFDEHHAAVCQNESWLIFVAPTLSQQDNHFNVVVTIQAKPGNSAIPGDFDLEFSTLEAKATRQCRTNARGQARIEQLSYGRYKVGLKNARQAMAPDALVQQHKVAEAEATHEYSQELGTETVENNLPSRSNSVGHDDIANSHWGVSGVLRRFSNLYCWISVQMRKPQIAFTILLMGFLLFLAIPSNTQETWQTTMTIVPKGSSPTSSLLALDSQEWSFVPNFVSKRIILTSSEGIRLSGSLEMNTNAATKFLPPRWLEYSLKVGGGWKEGLTLHGEGFLSLQLDPTHESDSATTIRLRSVSNARISFELKATNRLDLGTVSIARDIKTLDSSTP